MANPPATGGTLQGPWQSGLWFTVPGPVRSKSNHRRGDTGRKSHTTWRQLQSYELLVNSIARKYRPATWNNGNADDPVISRPRILVCAWARTTLDAGNVDKSVLDALEGTLYVNDAQVRWSLGGSTRTRQHPMLLVAVAQLPPGTGTLHGAAQQLLSQHETLLQTLTQTAQ